MNKSIILQVDESTKGLMEEIQSGISSSIEDGMREVKDKVDTVDGTTDMILRKFRNFDGLGSTVEQLRSLAEESKKFTAIVSPLESGVDELRQKTKTQEQVLSQTATNIDLLTKGVLELGGKQDKLTSDIKGEVENALSILGKDHQDARKLLNDALLKLSQAETIRQEISDKLSISISAIKDSITELSDRYAENESVHQAFESKTSSQIEDLSKSVEKIQATLDIIVNLVTPFWKKW